MANKPNPLALFMAQACYYAQQHIDDKAAWDDDGREDRLQCVSYQMACFFAQNTLLGDGGVDWDVMIKELVSRPMRSESQWLRVIERIAKQLGGWKDRDCAPNLKVDTAAQKLKEEVLSLYDTGTVGSGKLAYMKELANRI